jgi:predicted aldo/keto reductase-like oxidoreductase
MENSKGLQRRQFIKLSAASLSGVTLFSSFSPLSKPSSKKNSKIITRTLGRTGIKLPVVSLGAMRGDSKALIEAGIKLGIVHFDTAHSYQNGKNEEMLGAVLKNYKRKSYFIATKVVPDDMDRKTGEIGPGCTAEKFLEKLDLSLNRLQMKQVDLLYVHATATRQAVLHPEILKALKIAKEQGKVRFLGVSTHQNEPEVIQAAMDAGIYDVVLTSYNFKQDHRLELKESIRKAAAAGIGIIAMKTMAGGFLDKEKTKPINTKAALKWVLQDENVCTSIPGFTSFAQLEESFSVMEDINFTEQEKRDLEAAYETTGLYCNQCKACDGQCVKGLPINEIMRAYMYTYGYSETRKAQELLAELNVPANPCDDCTSCTVTCIRQFAVADKVKDVSRLMAVPYDFTV